jgi:chromate transporter
MVLLKLFLSFFKIGLFTVGGGYAMIPFVQREAVEVNKWILKKEFIEFVALDTVTPGPIAVNMATFVGYKVNGVLGAIVATVGVVLPSLILVTIIAAFFYAFKDNPAFQALLSALKPAVIALIIISVIYLLKAKAIADVAGFLLMLIVLAGVLVFHFNPMWMVLFSAISGFLYYYFLK